MRARSLSVLLGSLLAATPAHAAFHFMKIVEVYPGSTSNPSSQAVVLQMFDPGQNFVGGHSVRVYNAAGVLLGTHTFPGTLGNGANQAKILIATTQFQAEYGLTPDLVMNTATISPAGGKVCFDAIDCVTWGNYVGSGPVGAPAAGAGIPSGWSLARKLGANGVLEPIDDTEDSATDFLVARPAPRNNAGLGCGDGAVGTKEECDDADELSGDGCWRCGVETASVPGGSHAGLTLTATPNPFSSEVALQFTLSREAELEIGIYDLVGRRVRLLRTTLGSGPQRVLWDGRDDAGQEAGSGCYLVRARSQAFESTARLLRLR